MVRADCRKCVYFIPIRDFLELRDDRVSEWPRYVVDRLIEEYGHKEFMGMRVLGVCIKRKALVTYYEGRCRYFKPKKVWKQLTLEEVLKAKR